LRRKPPALLFVLPNLFTVSSIFCGFYAIVTSMDGSGPDRFYRAAVAILFAVVFDCADGRVARMTKTQSDFGVQLDSLADVISFGLAPALLVYEWALRSLGPAGIAICFIYAACGALRLARFNVMTQDQSESPAYFTGLPIPVAAASIVSLVLAHYRIGGGNLGNQPVMAVVMLLLSLLMVSSIHYRTFKKLPQHRLTMAFVLFLAMLVVVAAWKTGFSLMLVSLCAAFIALGLAEELVLQVRRLGVHSYRGLEEEDDDDEEDEKDTIRDSQI